MAKTVQAETAAAKAESDAVMAELEAFRAEAAAKKKKEKLILHYHNQYVAFITIVTFVPVLLLVGNCTFPNPFISESDAFCQDAIHLFTKFEFRESMRSNYKITRENFIQLVIDTVRYLPNLVIDTVTPYIVNATKILDESLQNYGGEYYVNAMTVYNNTFGRPLHNMLEFITDVLTLF